MTFKRTILLMLLLALGTAAWAQQSDKAEKPSKPSRKEQPTPKNMIEMGAHAGYLFVTGDVQSTTGYGVGMHMRKALDYIFSLRGEVMAGNTEGRDRFDRSFENNWYSANLWGLASLNSMRWNKPIRKLNIYGGLGVGANYYEVDALDLVIDQRVPDTVRIDGAIAPHMGLAFGFAIRLGKRFNIGFEHQSMMLLGRRADLLDGIEKEGNGIRTPFPDIMNYSNLRLNINIGNTSQNAEPLYWINPLDVVMKDIADTRKKVDAALKDSDGDGVPDIFDEEPNTPSGVPVDTKGRTLDSDRDGVPDYLDKEPFNPPREGERVDANGVVVNPINRPGMGVSEERVREIVDEMLREYQFTESANSVADWFLPMIHFSLDSYAIKYSDYGTLAGIARMMKSNPKLRLVVTGFTDQTGPEEHNRRLSYQRANAIIDHLVNNHGIGRGRFVLQWKGQEDALVPSSSSYMNRRVEFRAATASDVEMDPPSGNDPKKRDGY